MAKLDFHSLPEPMRVRFNYDREKAEVYQAQQAAYTMQIWADYQESTNRIAIRRAEEDAAAIAQEKEAQAAKDKEESERRVEELLEISGRSTEALERLSAVGSGWIDEMPAPYRNLHRAGAFARGNCQPKLRFVVGRSPHPIFSASSSIQTAANHYRRPLK